MKPSGSGLATQGYVTKGIAAATLEWSLQAKVTQLNPTFVIYTGAERYPTSSVSLTADVWNHVCGTFKVNDSMKIYVNGVETGSLTWNNSWVAPMFGTSSVQVGSMYPTGGKENIELSILLLWSALITCVVLLIFAVSKRRNKRKH